MDFTGVGFWEVIVIMVIAVLAVGPRRLPEIARKLGQMTNKFRMTATELTRSITAEVEEEASEINSARQDLKSEIEDTGREATQKRKDLKS